jgi:hypothetical protein
MKSVVLVFFLFHKHVCKLCLFTAKKKVEWLRNKENNFIKFKFEALRAVSLYISLDIYKLSETITFILVRQLVSLF